MSYDSFKIIWSQIKYMQKQLFAYKSYTMSVRSKT